MWGTALCKLESTSARLRPEALANNHGEFGQALRVQFPAEVSKLQSFRQVSVSS